MNDGRENSWLVDETDQRFVPGLIRMIDVPYAQLGHHHGGLCYVEPKVGYDQLKSRGGSTARRDPKV